MSLLLLLLLLCSSVRSESVRETETWVPMKTTQAVAMSTHHGDLESSGDSTNGSDFGFTDDEDRVNNNNDDDDDEGRVFNYDNYDNGGDEYYDDDDEYEEYDNYEEYSGSGDRETTESPGPETEPSAQPDVNDNKIPELAGPAGPARPTVNEVDLVQNRNEIPLLKRDGDEELLSNVLMSHAGDESVLNKTEVLAALIAAGVVCLMLAVLLILLLIYRMKKKDEGSYDLGKKPIYKKAPTTEIYA